MGNNHKVESSLLNRAIVRIIVLRGIIEFKFEKKSFKYDSNYDYERRFPSHGGTIQGYLNVGAKKKITSVNSRVFAVIQQSFSLVSMATGKNKRRIEVYYHLDRYKN